MRGLVSDPTLSPSADVYPIKMLSTLVSPLTRLLDDVPTWGWVAAALSGAWQFAASDAFTRLLFILLIAGTADYWFGVKAARYRGCYDPRIAHAGVIGKAAGLVVVMLLRLAEGWLLLANWVDSRGAVATAVGVALLSVDVQSIAHHREALGAPPVPVLSSALSWLRSIAAVKAPGERSDSDPDHKA